MKLELQVHLHVDEPPAWAVCESTAKAAAAAAAACIVPACITVYGCPLAYEMFLLQMRFNLEEPSDTESASVLASRIDQTNEPHFKLMTVCLNSVLHDLDAEALRVAKVGFTFFATSGSPLRWYLDQLCLYSKTN